MSKCRECGQVFKSISNTHLWYKHQLTVAQYAMKYGIDMAELVDKEVFILGAKTREDNREINNKRREEKVEELTEVAWNEMNKSLKNSTKQVLYGTLLGDGYLFRGKKLLSSTYLQIDHGIAQFAYLYWKYEMLWDLCPRITQNIKYLDSAQRVVAVTYLDTTSSYYYGKLAKMFYNKEGKIVTEEILNDLDDLGVAVWYMDDGSKAGNELVFNTQSFSFSDRERLIKFLNTRYQSAFHEVSYELGTLRCKVKLLGKFLEKVEPYILPMFKYKISKEEQIYATVVRRFKIDAAHFLEDYKGKCFCQHGHYYIVDVAVKGTIDPLTGMVVDFGYIKKIFIKYIDQVLDHKTINYVVPELRRRATAELMVVWMWKVLVELLPGLDYLQVWEQPEVSSVIYKGPSREDFKRKKKVDGLFAWAENAWQQLLKDYPDLQKRNDLYYSETRAEKTGKIASIHWPEGIEKLEDDLEISSELSLRDEERVVDGTLELLEKSIKYIPEV